MLIQTKIISLCASRDASVDEGYLVYRYGKLGEHAELEYPVPRVPPAKAFTFSSASGPKGGTEQLAFDRKGYRYTLYSNHWAGADPEENAGVIAERDGKRLTNVGCTAPLAPQDMNQVGPNEFGFQLHFIGLERSEIRLDIP